MGWWRQCWGENSTKHFLLLSTNRIAICFDRGVYAFRSKCVYEKALSLRRNKQEKKASELWRVQKLWGKTLSEDFDKILKNNSLQATEYLFYA